VKSSQLQKRPPKDHTGSRNAVFLPSQGGRKLLRMKAAAEVKEKQKAQKVLQVQAGRISSCISKFYRLLK